MGRQVAWGEGGMGGEGWGGGERGRRTARAKLMREGGMGGPWAPLADAPPELELVWGPHLAKAFARAGLRGPSLLVTHRWFGQSCYSTTHRATSDVFVPGSPVMASSILTA